MILFVKMNVLTELRYVETELSSENLRKFDNDFDHKSREHSTSIIEERGRCESSSLQIVLG